MNTNKKQKIRCSKCGFFRPDDTISPEWQCPDCHVAYAKAAKYEADIEVINQEREKANVLSLFDYTFLILLSIGLFFVVAPILNEFGNIILEMRSTINVNGLIFVLIAPVILILMAIFCLALTIIPLIVGIITHSLITNQKTYHRSMSIEEFIIVYLLMAGGNVFVNSDAILVSIVQALVTCTFMFAFAQKRTKSNTSYLKPSRPEFKIGSKIAKK